MVVENMKIIKRMFYAIILGLVLSILRPTIATIIDGNTAMSQAEECNDCEIK